MSLPSSFRKSVEARKAREQGLLPQQSDNVRKAHILLRALKPRARLTWKKDRVMVPVEDWERLLELMGVTGD